MSHREECSHSVDFAQYMVGEFRDGDYKLSMVLANLGKNSFYQLSGVNSVTR